MTVRPGISVVVSVKDNADTVEAAVRSAFADDVTMEVVVVDDHSSDESVDVLLAIDDPRVRVMANPGRGPADALNAAIAEARAPFIAVSDADDMSLPGRLALSHQTLASGDVDVCAGIAPNIDRSGIVLQRMYPMLTDMLIRLDLEMRSWCTHGAAAFTKEAFARTAGYRQEFWPCIDYDLWVQMAEAGCRFGGMPVDVYNYTVHPNQASRLLGRELAEQHRVISARACALGWSRQLTTRQLIEQSRVLAAAAGSARGVYAERFTRLLVDLAYGHPQMPAAQRRTMLAAAAVAHPGEAAVQALKRATRPLRPRAAGIRRR